jgi:uncharacterized protein (TIGR02246 family)
MSAETELDKLLQDWANSFEQKDAKACAACYKEDAWVLSSYGDKAHGLEAIEATMREWIEGGAKNKKFTNVEILIDNGLAYSMVAYSEDFDNDDGFVFTETGKAVNIFKRQTDGSWKYHVNVLTSDNPSSE